MDNAKLRGWRAHNLGLAELTPTATPFEVFGRSGWCRSLAGCNPYLTAFSRARIGRAAMDQAVQDLEISELPAARACTYVLPKSDFAIALVAGGSNSNTGDMRTAVALGATPEEIEALCAKVLNAVQGSPKDPAELRAELGSAVRSFGEAGKKKGLTTSLPLALSILQSDGKIVRRPLSGRLDEQRYAYEAWNVNPPDVSGLSKGDASKQLAILFFGWIGPATLAEFATFAALSLKGAKAACEGLELTHLEGEPDLLMMPTAAAAFERFKVHDEPVYRLINCLDSLLILHDRYDDLFAPHHLERAKSVKDDSSYNAIIDRGTVVGFWEFDGINQELVAWPFVPMTPDLKSEIERTESFIKEELGDARTFSLDSPKSRQPKIERLRAAVST